MLNTIQRNTHLTATQWSSAARPSAPSFEPAESANVDRFSPTSSADDGAATYNPRMFFQRFGTASSNGNAHASTSGSESGNASTEGYGGRRFSTSGPRQAAALYRGYGDESMSLDSRSEVGRLISHSPQIDGMGTTDGDQNRCGGAAIFNAMLLDGDHAANATAIRETLGTHITPEQRTALDHMQAGRLSPNEAANLQEAIFDHSESLNGTVNNGLNLQDMRRTVAELREHGAFPNTRELNFRREIVDTTSNSSHWTVSSRTAHGTHFADSYPQANGCARVTGGEEAAFTPWDGEDRAMSDSLTFRRGAGGAEFQETVEGSHGQWQQRDYTVSQARGTTTTTAHDMPEDF